MITGKEKVEDHLNWLFRTTYFIELHINAFFFLDNLFNEAGLKTDNNSEISFLHYNLALVKFTTIGKVSPNKDEKRTIFKLKELLLENNVYSDKLYPFFKRIEDFQNMNTIFTNHIKNNRDDAVHEFHLEKSLEINSNSSFPIEKLKFTFDARLIIEDLFEALFNEKIDQDLAIDTKFYNNVYARAFDLFEKPSDDGLYNLKWI